MRNGKINEREARTHPRRNVLQKALGGGNQFVDPQVGAVGYERGDIFLLCTDGLIDGLSDAQLVELLRADGPFRATTGCNLRKKFRPRQHDGAGGAGGLKITKRIRIHNGLKYIAKMNW